MKAIHDLGATFSERLGQHLRVLEQAEGGRAFVEALVGEVPELWREMEKVLGKAAKAVERNPKAETEDLQQAYWRCFHWADLAKSYLLVWRNTLFEWCRAEVMVLDGRVEEVDLQELYRAGLENLKATGADLLQHLEMEPGVNSRRLFNDWRQQQNPWPVYQEQMAQLPEQCRRIGKDHEELRRIAGCFGDIRKLVQGMIGDCQESTDRVTEQVRYAMTESKRILEEEPNQQFGRVASRLEDIDQEIEVPHHLNEFTPVLDELIEQLPGRKSVPIAARAGIIELFEVHFSRSTLQWLKSEILPLLYEIWELTDAAGNESKMALVNLQNWSMVLAKEVEEGKAPTVSTGSFVQILAELEARLLNSRSKIDELETLVKSRLGRHFCLSEIFNEEDPFLPVALQSTIEQLRLNQNLFLGWVKNFAGQQWERLQQLLRRVEEEEALTQAEKVTRFIRERQSDPASSQYASIFLTKGFVSSSFIVGREEELKHAESVVESWKKGFRGSLLVTGSRLSGKTLFGELLATRNFGNQTLRLQPNSHFFVEGRKYETSFDLAKALDQIRRFPLREPTLVWIDDLEHWWSPEYTYYQNALALKEFLDHSPSRVFVMVAMGNCLRPRLGKMMDWGNLFQAWVRMDEMRNEEVREAILIRHSATHQQLVNREGEELNPQEFRRLTNKIFHASHGNIGEALNMWAFSTRQLDEEQVQNQFSSDFTLPNFVNPDLSILLSSVMMQRKTNERRLRKFFGPVFSKKYAPLVRRLLSMGVLVRGIDGWLEVQPLLVNELGRILQKEGYLSYER